MDWVGARGWVLSPAEAIALLAKEAAPREDPFDGEGDDGEVTGGRCRWCHAPGWNDRHNRGCEWVAKNERISAAVTVLTLAIGAAP